MSNHRLFVLVKCEVGRANEVGDAITDTIEGTFEVYSITGEFDLLVKLPLRDLDAIAVVLVAGIHKIPGIPETSTFVSFRVYGKDIGDFVE